MQGTGQLTPSAAQSAGMPTAAPPAAAVPPAAAPAPPRPALNYEQLAYYEDKQCIVAEHESAVKRAIWNLTIGLAHIRRLGDTTHFSRAMAIVGIKTLIWDFVDIDKPVQLTVGVVTPATSLLNATNSCANVLAGTHPWMTKDVPTGQVESAVVGVAAGSRVVSFDIATLTCAAEQQIRVEEVNAVSGAVGATLIAWNNFGNYSPGISDRGRAHGNPFALTNYTAATVAVETKATRFKISVRHTHPGGVSLVGLTIFRATGLPPRTP